MKNRNPIVLVVCAIAVTSAWFTYAAPQANPPNTKVIGKLTEIVQLLEGQERQQHLLASAGQSDQDPAVSTAQLLRARIDLARELGQHSQVTSRLQDLVKVYEARYQRARARMGIDRLAAVNARIELLRAEIELEKSR